MLYYQGIIMSNSNYYLNMTFFLIITRFFYPETSDDVIAYMSSDEVEKLVNSVVKREDLSIEV